LMARAKKGSARSKPRTEASADLEELLQLHRAFLSVTRGTFPYYGLLRYVIAGLSDTDFGPFTDIGSRPRMELSHERTLTYLPGSGKVGGPGGIWTRDLPDLRPCWLANRTFFGPLLIEAYQAELPAHTALTPQQRTFNPSVPLHLSADGNDR